MALILVRASFELTSFQPLRISSTEACLNFVIYSSHVWRWPWCVKNHYHNYAGHKTNNLPIWFTIGEDLCEMLENGTAKSLYQIKLFQKCSSCSSTTWSAFNVSFCLPSWPPVDDISAAASKNPSPHCVITAVKVACYHGVTSSYIGCKFFGQL